MLELISTWDLKKKSYLDNKDDIGSKVSVAGVGGCVHKGEVEAQVQGSSYEGLEI